MANISLPRDNNRVTVIGGTSSVDGVTPVAVYVDPTTHRILVDSAGGGGGSPGGSTTQLQYNSSGSFAGITNVVTDGTSLGLRTAAPTHDVTFASTSNGLALYNTVDQTTNYERLLMQWSSNVFTINSGIGGTGTNRDLIIGAGASNSVRVNFSGTPKILVNWVTGTANAYGMQLTGQFTASSGTNIAQGISTTISQSSTAGYTMLLVNPTESTVGSGTKLLADFQVGGTSKAKIDNLGNLTSASTATTGLISATALTTPSAPTVTNQGAAGSTSYTYLITARTLSGETIQSSTTVTATGNATLTGSNFNRITWSAVTGAADYRVWRTASSGTPSSTGVIGTVLASATLSLDDTGLTATAANTPSQNTTNGLAIGVTSASTLIDVVYTNSAAKTYLIGLRNASTSTGTESTIKFANTTVATDVSSSGSGEIGVIRVNTPNAGDTDMVFRTVTTGTITERLRLNATGLTIPSGHVIDLGSTDTTLSRLSAGVLAVEGAAVLTTATGLDTENADPAVINEQVVGISAVQSITNKRIKPRTSSSTSNASLTPDVSTANVYYRTTQTTGLTINAPTGTPIIGETIVIYVDSAGAQTLTIDATYKVFGAAFPASTTAGKTFMMSAQYNGTDWKTLWANAQ